MPERVDFYLIDSDQVDDRLRCACKIASKAYAQGLKVYMQTETSTDLESLDGLLWSFNDASFIPHQKVGLTTQAQTKQVLLGDSPMPAAIAEGWDELLISLTESVPEDVARFSRVADLISADEPSKQQGRERFKHYRSLNIEPKTHQINA